MQKNGWACYRRSLRFLNRRSGFTVIEVLVVMGVIGLLAALAIPAVQSARASSRLVQCTSNLRNLGVALSAHESANGALPSGIGWVWGLLPFLERKTITDAVEAILSPELINYDDAARQLFPALILPELLCPADGAEPVLGPVAMKNYAACYASLPLKHGRNGALGARDLSNQNPARGLSDEIRLAEITDGLSNTAAFSEFLHGNGELSRLRAVWSTTAYYEPEDADELVAVCESIPPNAAELGWLGSANKKGGSWWNGDHGIGMYNHALPPNRPSCINGTKVWSGVYTASSQHPGGVNLLFVDGHVQFQSESIDLKVWRALASRSGRDD